MNIYYFIFILRSIYDNNTAVYYETWTVYNTHNSSNNEIIMYFDSFDCASWVLR